MTQRGPFRYFKTSPEVIRLAVMLYVRFPLVATCLLNDGTDLSAEMVKAGLALDWPKFSGGRYRKLEVDGVRKKLWRVDARQRGRI